MKQTLRAFSLPLLWWGDRLRNSPSLWFMGMALGALGWCTATGFLKVLCAEWSIVSFLVSGYWASARWQRRLGVRRLAAQACPACGVQIGGETTTRALAEYARSCSQFIRECRAKGAFSIEPALPVGFSCHGCSRGLFYDYLGSDELLLNEDDEPPAPASETDASR